MVVPRRHDADRTRLTGRLAFSLRLALFRPLVRPLAFSLRRVFSLQPGFLLLAGIFCFGLWPVFRFGLHFRRRQPFASHRASLLLRIVPAFCFAS
jgi:hypothetical protein